MATAAQVGQEWKFVTGSGEERLYRLSKIYPSGAKYLPILKFDRIDEDSPWSVWSAWLHGEKWLREPLGSGHWELVS